MKKKPLIGIIDTKTSNIKSVYYALSLYDVDINYVTSIHEAKKIDAMIVPGIGNFSYVIKKLKENNLDKYILENISMNIPSLFICVGMQILLSKSYEFGEHEGLNIFKGSVDKISGKGAKGEKTRKVPMIGWNNINIKKKCKILTGIKKSDFFYFTHSYYAEPKNKEIISSTSNYSGFTYCSSISSNNIFATQFHPEKSGEPGLKIYKNFINLI